MGEGANEQEKDPRVRVIMGAKFGECLPERAYLYDYVMPSLSHWCKSWGIKLQFSHHYWEFGGIAEKFARTSKPILLFFLSDQHTSLLDNGGLQGGLARDFGITDHPISMATKYFLEHLDAFFEPLFYFCRSDHPHNRQSRQFQDSVYRYYAQKGAKTPFIYQWQEQYELAGPSLKTLKKLEQRLIEDVKHRISQITTQKSSIWQRGCRVSPLYTEPFLGRFPILCEIRQYLLGNSRQMLLLYGGRGSGKTAILARVYQDFHQFCQNRDIEFFAFFFGMSIDDDFSRLSLFLQQLSELLARPIRSGEDLFRALQGFSRKIVILLDGIDHLSAGKDVIQMDWLPSLLPKNAKLIVSTGDMEIKKILAVRASHCLDIPPLKKEEMSEIFREISLFLESTTTLRDPLAFFSEREPTPLFARLVAEEIYRHSLENQSQYEIAEQLPLSTEDFLAYRYQQQKNFYSDREIMEALCQLLRHTRYGLAREELAELLLEIDESGIHKVLMQQHSDHFVSRGGLWQLAQRNSTREKDEQLHCYLAEYFQQRPLYFAGVVNTNKLLEQPWQQAQAGMWQELVRTICDIDFLEAKVEADLLLDLQNDYRFALASMPKFLTIEIAPGVTIDKNIIALVERILRLETQFLKRHPQSLLQTLWNYGYWHDCPKAANHYRYYHKQKYKDPPWHSLQPKLYRLVEHWRMQRNGKFWLKAISPMPYRLDSPLCKILRGHQRSATCPQFTENGTILSGSRGSTAFIWDRESGSCLYSFPYYEDTSGLSFSNDAGMAAREIRHHCKLIEIWDISRQECVHVFTQYFSRVHRTVFSPTNDRIAILFPEKLEVWDLQSDKPQLLLIDRHNGIRDLRFSPDGQKIIYNKGGRAIMKRLLAKATLLDVTFLDPWAHSMGDKKREYHSPIQCVNINRQGDKVITGAKNGTVCIWNAKTENILHVLSGQGDSIYHVCFSSDERKVAVQSKSKINIWELDSRRLVRSLNKPIFSSWNAGVEFISEDNALVLGMTDGSVQIWDLEHKYPYYIPIIEKALTSVAATTTLVTPDGNFTAVMSDRMIQIYDLFDDRIHQISISEGSFCGAIVIFSPDSSKIAVLTMKNTIYIWDLYSGRELHYLETAAFRKCMCFSPDSNYIACGANDEIEIWDLSLEMVMAISYGNYPDDIVTSICFNENGELLASGGTDKKVRIWDAKSGRLVHEFIGHDSTVSSVEFLSEERLLLSQDDKTIKKWDLEKKLCVETKPLVKKCPKPGIAEGTYQVVSSKNETVVSQITEDGSNAVELAVLPGEVRDAHFTSAKVLMGHFASYPCFFELQCGD